MKVVGLHHVNLNARDVGEAVAFYTSLGFEEIARPDFGFPGAWLQMGRNQLHLSTPATIVVDQRQHFALQVDDLAECAAELESLGVQTFELPAVTGAGRQIFFRDPTGNLIELNQPDR